MFTLLLLTVLPADPLPALAAPMPAMVVWNAEARTLTFAAPPNSQVWSIWFIDQTNYIKWSCYQEQLVLPPGVEKVTARLQSETNPDLASPWVTIPTP